ncbi:IS630 family transposase, partial [Zooshikella harenae]
LKHPKANEEKREAFQGKINAHKSKGRLMVYLDESGFAQDMPRIHGYSHSGKRCYGVHDWQAKGRINAIGAIVGMTFLTVGLFEGSINSDVFYAWLTQELIPVLPENAVVVMDNASFHKRRDIIDAIEQSGALLEFLPPYSPDFNPIEKKWAQVKSIRKRERCDVDTLFVEHIDYDKL